MAEVLAYAGDIHLPAGEKSVASVKYLIKYLYEWEIWWITKNIVTDWWYYHHAQVSLFQEMFNGIVSLIC